MIRLFQLLPTTNPEVPDRPEGDSEVLKVEAEAMDPLEDLAVVSEAVREAASRQRAATNLSSDSILI